MLLGVADYPAFCFAVLVFLALPGPGTFCILANLSKFGVAGGLAATVGVLVGDQIILWLAATGLAAVLSHYPVVFDGLRWLGVGYLIFVGAQLFIQSIRSPRNSGAGFLAASNTSQNKYQSGFGMRHQGTVVALRDGIFITLLNPKALLFYFSFFPLFIDPTNYQGVRTLTLMSATIAAITLIYCSGLVAVVAMLRHYFQTTAHSTPAPRSLRSFLLSGQGLLSLLGLGLVGFGLRLLISR